MAIDKTISILIVDDNKPMLRIVRGLLAQLGFTRVSEAADGATALEKLTQPETPYSLVIADWDMTPSGGLDLLNHVRAIETLQSLPFILAADQCRLEDVMTAKKAGVSHFIIKPFNAVTLKKKLYDVLGGS